MSPIDVVDCDYDDDPERFRTNVLAVEQYGLVGDVHEEVALRLAAEGMGDVLDVGCGEGRFTVPARAQGLSTVAFDFSMTMLEAVAPPRLQGDACILPFADATFGAVVALYMLYHLPDPSAAIAECHRVLAPGGLFVACAPSRYNDPELVPFVSQSRETFDAENGRSLIGDHFQEVEVERWDAPLLHLPDADALALYLRGRQLDEDQVHLAMSHVPTPVTLTKRGALFYARRGATR